MTLTKEVIATVNLSKVCFYEIEEGTKNERLGVDGRNQVVRWRANGKDDQKFLLVPLGDQWVNIVSKKGRGNYCTVSIHDSTGRMFAQEKKETGKHKKNQQFRLIPHEDGWYEIEEGTKNERVSVGSNGAICRWFKTKEKSQRFRFIPIPELTFTPPKPRTPEYEPGKIGDIPRMEKLGIDEIPEQTKEKLVAEGVVPYYAIKDKAYQRVIDQAEETPYYVISRYQRWQRFTNREFEGRTEEHYECRHEIGIKEKESLRIRETVGIVLFNNGCRRNDSDFVFCIQECGKTTTQATPRGLSQQQWNVSNSRGNDPIPCNAILYQWSRGRNSNYYRCSLGILTSLPLRNANPNFGSHQINQEQRPIVWVEVSISNENYTFISMHAPAGGNQATADYIQAVYNWIIDEQDEQDKQNWGHVYLAGDFNMELQNGNRVTSNHNLQLQCGNLRICSPNNNQITHQNGSRIDYITRLTSSPILCRQDPQWYENVTGDYVPTNSDHFPVWAWLYPEN